MLVGVSVHEYVATENAHDFIWVGCGLQGTPFGDLGETEGVEGANGAFDNVGSTDEYHFEAFSVWREWCRGVGGDGRCGGFVGVWEKFFHYDLPGV